MTEPLAERAEHPPYTPLVAAVLTQMANDTAFTTNALLDSYKHRADKAEATLNLIREHIGDLLAGPYMPTSLALAAALWPSDAAVEAEMKAGGDD